MLRKVRHFKHFEKKRRNPTILILYYLCHLCPQNNVKIKAFLCDGPIRAFLKGIILHTGYFSFKRCTVRGT